MSADLLKSTFVNEWKNEMISIIKKTNPKWDDNQIEEIIDKMVSENVQVPKVTIDNNYIGKTKETHLLSVFDWIMERKPIIGGNGTFYKNQYEAMNPIAKMLEKFLTQRKKIKKQMFAVKDTDPDLYASLDRGQLNEKINANSYYGASGMPKSAFYSQWSGPRPCCCGSMYSNVH